MSKWTSEQLELRAKRLDELSIAVADGRRSESTMRVPAEPDRDADLVLQDAANIVRAYAATLDHPATPEPADAVSDELRPSFDAWFAGTNPKGVDLSEPNALRDFAYQAWKDRAALESFAARHARGVPDAYFSRDNEGNPSMLFFDRNEALQYCDDDEQPGELFAAQPTKDADHE